MTPKAKRLLEHMRKEPLGLVHIGRGRWQVTAGIYGEKDGRFYGTRTVAELNHLGYLKSALTVKKFNRSIFFLKPEHRSQEL